MSTRIVDTGSANTRSVETALRRCGLEPRTARDAAEVRDADRLVLPGVGSFGAAAGRISEQGLAAALRERIAAGRPTLAVCVGLQLLARSSEESPGVEGLGVLEAEVRRFDAAVRVPHMGWNRVRADWLPPGHASFANSYRIGAEAIPRLLADGWEVATTDHGGAFVAALRRGGVLACQFHPELSGAWGEALLARWVARGREEVPAC